MWYCLLATLPRKVEEATPAPQLNGKVDPLQKAGRSTSRQSGRFAWAASGRKQNGGFGAGPPEKRTFASRPTTAAHNLFRLSQNQSFPMPIISRLNASEPLPPNTFRAGLALDSNTPCHRRGIMRQCRGLKSHGTGASRLPSTSSGRRFAPLDRHRFALKV